MKKTIYLSLLTFFAVNILAMGFNAMVSDEEDLRRIWGHLQQIESKIKVFTGTSSVIFYVMEREKCQQHLYNIKEKLPKGRGDAIIKELEKKYKENNEKSE